MQLNDLKSAWRQLKLVNTFDHVESKEILSIIETPENTNRGKLQRVFFNMVIFIIITMICQSG